MSGPTAAPNIEAVLREEIALAQALLVVQREVWDALCQAEPAARLEPRLGRQESAFEAVRRASLARADALEPFGGLEPWLASLPLAAIPPFRALREEAGVLRNEIQSLATQCSWLARRSAYWLEAQRALVGELAAERLGAGTSGGGGRKSGDGQVTASLLDRSA
jgi:hypothetical protein